MKSVKKLVLAAAVLPLALSTASAYAFGGKHGGGPCGDAFGPRLLDKLELTDEQYAQLRELRKAKREEMKANYEANRETKQAERQASREARHEAMQDLMLSGEFDEAKARELAQQMSEERIAQRTEQQVKMMQAKHEMLSILTDEQKTKLFELQDERMEQCVADMDERGRGGKRGHGKHW